MQEKAFSRCSSSYLQVGVFVFVVARAQKNERDGKQVGRKEKELAVKNEWGLEHRSRIEAPPNNPNNPNNPFKLRTLTCNEQRATSIIHQSHYNSTGY